MNELMNTVSVAMQARRQLLASVSATMLLLSATTPVGAQSMDGAEHPSVWIELGGQLQRVDGNQQSFSPAFIVNNAGAPYDDISPLNAERAPRYAIGGEGRISFEPDGSDWVLSAAITYGRSNRNKHVHQQSSMAVPRKLGQFVGTHSQVEFDDTVVEHHESHTVLDFMVGKDVGLGLFGRKAESILNFGVRAVQFESRSTSRLLSLPDPYYKTNVKYNNANPPNAHHHSYYASAQLARSFRGLGPSLSWSGSAPLVGNEGKEEISFDWGANAAVLFGRQKVSGSHYTTARYFQGQAFIFGQGGPPLKSRYTHFMPVNRARSIVVPNVGGFAGLSYRFPNAKVSMGYRADAFFGAMDGGIDARKSYNQSFYGPFATISIGLGG